MRQAARIKIAKRIVQEFKEEQVVNLGVGIPTIIHDYLDGKKLFLQSENGLLGMGPTPPDKDIDMDLISASKQPITMEPGAVLFDSTDSFLMIRGGHIDVAVIGALQIDEKGKIANWAVPGKTILGVGGAMDLVVGAKKIIVATMHTAKDSSAKLVKELTFPSSGGRTVDMVVTEHAVFTFQDRKMKLIELLSDITLNKLKEITDANYEVALDQDNLYSPIMLADQSNNEFR